MENLRTASSLGQRPKGRSPAVARLARKGSPTRKECNRRIVEGKLDVQARLPVPHRAKTALAPSGTPAILEDPARRPIVVADYCHRVQSQEIPCHVPINAIAVVEEVLKYLNPAYDGAVGRDG